MPNTETAVKKLSMYGIGTVARQLVGFIMLPIYTRYLTPADYGIVALLTVSLAVFEIFVGARFGPAVQRFYLRTNDLSQRNRVVSTATVLSTLFSGVGVVLLFRNSATISNLIFGSTQYEEILALFSLTLVTSVIESYGLLYIRLRDKSSLFLFLSLSKVALQVILSIVFIVQLDYGVLGVVFTTVSTSLAFALITGFLMLRTTGVGVDIEIGKKLFNFSWPLWLAGFVTLYETTSNRYFLRVFGSLEQVGLFSVALQFASLQSSLVRNPFNQWWQTQRFIVYDAPLHGIETFRAVFVIYFVIMCISGIGIAIFSEPVLVTIAGAPFHDAATAIPILVISVLIQNITMYANFSFHVTDNTDAILRIRILNAVLVTALFLILIPKYGFMGAGVSILASSFVTFYVTHRSSIRHADVGINKSLFHGALALLIVAVIIDQLYISGKGLLQQVVLKAVVFLLFLGSIYVVMSRSGYTIDFFRKLMAGPVDSNKERQRDT